MNQVEQAIKMKELALAQAIGIRNLGVEVDDETGGNHEDIRSYRTARDTSVH